MTNSIDSSDDGENISSANIDGLVKSLKRSISVIPAKSGIQLFQDVLDPGFRRGDDWRDFLRDHQYSCQEDNLEKFI